jgi:hypothetical protein
MITAENCACSERSASVLKRGGRARRARRCGRLAAFTFAPSPTPWGCVGCREEHAFPSKKANARACRNFRFLPRRRESLNGLTVLVIDDHYDTRRDARRIPAR